MKNKNLNIKVLYYFENPNFLLFEIKRLDLADDAPKEDLYSWYFYDQKLGKKTKLTFESLSEGKRIFREGELYFDDKKGHFNNISFLRTNTASFPCSILE